MEYATNIWNQKNATLSDKSAAKEYGLSRDDIYKAINAGELQFRETSLYGNVWFRLIREEVESLVAKKFGAAYLNEIKSKKELSEINKELKTLYDRVAELENRKKELLNKS